jgi:Domain of unknown function (DUF1963)/Regulator of chromosome condensation (RCC1) repeat
VERANSDLRARFEAAGLARYADGLLGLTDASVRLCPHEWVGAKGLPFKHTPVETPGHIGGVVAIASTVSCRFALISDGSLMAWGGNQTGQLGDGTKQDRREPVRVRDLDDVIAIAAGAAHALALRADGSVVGWGDNRWGALGDGTREHRRKPVAVRGLEGGVVAIAAGANNSLALMENGSVVGWGLAVVQQGLENIPDRPVPIAGLTGGVVAIAVAGGHGHHRLALSADGTVLAWGSNLFGVLGDPEGERSGGSWRPTPTEVTALAGRASAIAAGYSHSLALMADGSVYAWGDNVSGALGDGTRTTRSTPAPVVGIEGTVVAIAADLGCSFALLADGAVLSWGWNYRGQLGDGTATNRLRPVPAKRLDRGVSAIAPGLALRGEGSILEWAGEQESEPRFPPGVTRLGGHPDGRRDGSWSWPTLDGRPMAFLAQINLADVAPLEAPGRLPSTGLLSFFCATQDLDREGSCHVHHTDAAIALAMHPAPKAVPDYDRFGEVSLRPEAELSCAPWESSSVERLGLSAQERFAYRDALEDDDDLPLHRMLGHPDVIQNDPRDERPSLCLLLQIDSNYGAGMQWGDGGRLYFWIEFDDLEARLFERTQVEIQSY